MKKSMANKNNSYYRSPNASVIGAFQLMMQKNTPKTVALKPYFLTFNTPILGDCSICTISPSHEKENKEENCQRITRRGRLQHKNYNGGFNMVKEGQFGALWNNDDFGGMLSGVIEIEGQKIKILCFKNKYKEEESNQPDWIICKSQIQPYL